MSAVSSEPVGALGGADYRLRQRFDTDVRLAGLHGSRVPRRIRSKSRIPRVLTGSTPYAIFCRPSREATGNFYIDDEVLAAEGITDLSGYRCGDAAEEDLATDLFV